ncbi:MAG: hypothetical protein ACN4G0_14045 [Polyangiales bacterium]
MSETNRAIAILIGVLVATCVVMFPVFQNGFVFDDLFVFVIHDVIYDLSNIPAFFTHSTTYAVDRVDPMVIDTYRPLTLTTFTLDAALTGRVPFGYHVTNLLLHLLCISLVFGVARVAMSKENQRFAWLPAAWFAFSPWIGEGHIWINGRSDPLCTVMLLGAILVWHRALVTRRAWLYPLSGLLVFASLLSKEVALGAMPAMLLWPPLAELRPKWRDRIVALAVPATASVVYLLVRIRVLDGMRSHGDASQLLSALSAFGLVFFDGLRTVLAPSAPYIRMMLDSYGSVGLAARVALCVLALLVIAVAWFYRRRQPALAWSLVFFAGTLGPVVLITTVLWPGFGRYLYLPLAGLSVGVVDAAISGLRRLGAFDSARLRVVLGVAVAAYLGLSAFMLRGFVRDFESDGTLYGAVIETDPSASHGYGYLGMSLVNIQQPEASLEYLRKAIELEPTEPKYRVGLGQALIDLDRNEEAAALLGRWASESGPSSAPMFLHRMAYALQEIDMPRAVAALLACLRIDSRWGSCLDRLAELSRDDTFGPGCREALRQQLENPVNAEIASTVRAAVLLEVEE